jgi:hypothetical protein
MHEGRIVTAGGRVLTVVGSGKDYRQAIDVAYDAARRVSFDGLHMRRDIGFKAVTDSGFGIRDSGVGKDDPRRFVTTNRLRVPNPESPIPESRISESRIPNPESRTPNPEPPTPNPETNEHQSPDPNGFGV